MTVIPRGISAINLLFTSLVRKFVLSLNKSVSSPLQLIFSAPTQVLSLPLSLTLFFFLSAALLLYQKFFITWKQGQIYAFVRNRGRCGLQCTW